MIRTVITRAGLLTRIRHEAGPAAASTATALLDFAHDIGAEQKPRQDSISVRLPGPVGSEQEWLTLYVVSVAGTFYTNWLDRWAKAGAPEEVATAYWKRLAHLVGASTHCHPTAYRKAVPLSAVAEHLDEVQTAVRGAVAALRSAVRDNVTAGRPAAAAVAAKAADLENARHEAMVLLRTRSRPLRAEALRRADGVCAGCGKDYSTVLGGRGRRVLQVHHRKQLAAADTPVVTAVDDLAVVCSNCHALIHSDPGSPIDVDDLRAMLAADQAPHDDGGDQPPK